MGGQSRKYSGYRRKLSEEFEKEELRGPGVGADEPLLRAKLIRTTSKLGWL
jgi:hypothetical protein